MICSKLQKIYFVFDKQANVNSLTLNNGPAAAEVIMISGDIVCTSLTVNVWISIC